MTFGIIQKLKGQCATAIVQGVIFIRVAFRSPVTRNSHNARRAPNHAQLEPTTDHDPQARRAAIIALLEASTA